MRAKPLSTLGERESEREVTFAVLNLSNFYTSGDVVCIRMYDLYSTISLHVNQKAHVALNFNCLFENERLFKGHRQSYSLHCKCGNISKQCKMEPLLLYSLQTTNRK